MLYDGKKNCQLQVVEAALAKITCLVVMPTGGRAANWPAFPTRAYGKVVAFVVTPLKSFLLERPSQLLDTNCVEICF